MGWGQGGFRFQFTSLSLSSNKTLCLPFILVRKWVKILSLYNKQKHRVNRLGKVPQNIFLDNISVLKSQNHSKVCALEPAIPPVPGIIWPKFRGRIEREGCRTEKKASCLTKAKRGSRDQPQDSKEQVSSQSSAKRNLETWGHGPGGKWGCPVPVEQVGTHGAHSDKRCAPSSREGGSLPRKGWEVQALLSLCSDFPSHEQEVLPEVHYEG